MQYGIRAGTNLNFQNSLLHPEKPKTKKKNIDS